MGDRVGVTFGEDTNRHDRMLPPRWTQSYKRTLWFDTLDSPISE